ncbi:Rib/alpha-like domain-containing protein [Streptococcus parasanguinis]|uniref:Rib/alpha-like domain-containing protein n=1 Tax=Streptococcus parasanguinis TaxID=1318 RepID=UPI000E010BA5|nr:Rib/alpha-like domain-containing protein [Streptococcus parasanguinis]SUN83382.1 R28 protein [Streptococcus parasanguinis]
MYFNRKNTEQKNWRMIKKGKHFLFGCSLVLAIGAVMAAPSVKADEADAKDANGVSASASENESATITSGTNPSTYSAPAETTATPVVTTSNSSASVESSSTTQKESDSVQAPSLTTVADASALTAEEISNVTEAIKGSNPTAVSVQVSNDGSAVVTFADGSSASLSASQTVKVKVEATSGSETHSRSRRAAAPANGTTRSFDSELQNEAQRKAIYSPGVKGEKQTYEGTVWLYRNGTVNNDSQKDAKRLGGVNVYLQYVTGKGFVSPVYKTTSEQDGTFVFDLSKPLANRLGATGEFKLAGDPKFAIRTWVENPDPTKYTVIKSGDQRTGFHGRLSRLNETWDFTAGINRIVGGQVVLQEKPNSEDYLLKPEADRQTGDQADGQFSRKGDYGTIRGKVWYELRDPSGSDARMYKKDSYDINATNVKVAASYVNDEVTRLFDKWKSEHSNYKLDDFKAAQAEIIRDYEARNGKGSHIAETVVVPVDKDGNYRIPFRGLYGVSATQANSGLKISHKISDQEFGTLVKDEDLDNEHLMKWNGTIGQKHRHINTDYVYATVLVNDYAIWSNNYQSNMFEGTSDAVLPVGPSSLAAANISNTNFALIAPQPMHDILVYDNSDHFAKPGNTAESTTGGLMPSREYQIRWFKNGQAIGTATTVTSTADGTASSVPFTVPSDLTEAAIYTSAVFLQGENTDDLHSALALDSFTAVPNEDADKYTPTPKDQTVNVGETPDPKKSIGNVGDLPNGTTFEYKTPVDTTTPGDKSTTVVVTYPDGSKDEVPVTVKVVDPRTDADKNTPTPKDQTVNVGETPDAKNSIGNVSDLPSGTTFEYKTPVDTTTPGDKSTTVVVTYPDGSKDEVPVKVTVKDPRTDADKNTPTPKDQTVNVGETPDAKNSIGNVSDLPSGTTFEYKTPVDTTTPGDKSTTVVVTYPDGSKDEVPVKVTVKDPRTDADKNTPTPKDQTVNVGETPDAKKSIGNVGDLPNGTTFEYKTPVDTTTPGDKSTTVVVTYPDGSKDEVPVTVKVVDPRTDADKNTPVAKDQTVKVGDTPDAKKSIGNVSDLPSGTTFEYKTPVDTTTEGDKDATVVVTYPDGSKDEVPVKVTVAANPTQADVNTPVAKDQTVNIGDTPDAKNSIGNVSDLPSGTTFEYKTPVDTTTTGDKSTTVVVTYPDGSKDEVPVTVKVVDPRTDADKNTPVAKDQTVKVGDTPDAKKSIGNVSDLPSGTTFEYKTPVDTTTEGDKDATVVVTYPDGSKDEVPVKVTVAANPTQADVNTPVAKDQTVNIGDTPDAKNSIGNVSDLPSGTTFEYKTPVDTTTAGEKDATVVVTYPDGSKDEVPVKVTVKDPRTDADKNTPVAKDQTVKPGDQPNAKDSIGNVGDLPEGTKFEYKTPVDTTTEGDKDAIVVVTYPDGSKDEVPVKVTVKDPRTDADKNTPVAKDQTVKPGDQPNAKDSIGNVGDLPKGTKFEYKTPVDTTTEGEKDAIVVVTYPDGSKDEVPVKVTVKAPHANTDKNTPTSKDQTVNKVETPDAKNSEKEIQVQKVSVSDKKAESAKLPNTGEEQSTSIALLGAVLGMFGLAGLAKRKKNED